MTTQVVCDYNVQQVGTTTAARLETTLGQVPLPLAYLNAIGVRVISDTTVPGPPIRRRVTLGFLPASTATATAALAPSQPTGSPIESFTVTAPGSGYVAAPNVEVAGSGGGVYARALLKVLSAAAPTTGAGYNAATAPVFYGGLAPYNAVFPATASGPLPRFEQKFLQLISINLTAPGSAYSAQTKVNILGGLCPNPGGFAASAAPVIRAGALTSIDVLAPGQLYIQPPTIQIVDPTGSGSGATATVTLANMVPGLSLFYAGRPATGTFTFSGGSITGVTIVDGGEGYIGSPSIAAIDPTGSGSGALFTTSLGVGEIDVSNGGQGFIPTPTVALVPFFKTMFPDGTDQAAPFANLLTAAIQAALRCPIQTVYPVVS